MSDQEEARKSVSEAIKRVAGKFVTGHGFQSTPGGTYCAHLVSPGKVCGEPLAKHTYTVSLPEREQHWPGGALAVWDAHADAVLALLRKKQAYGTAWKDAGYMGNLARILSKASRLRNLMWRDPSDEEFGTGTAFDESVLDTLYDLSALCSFAISNIEEGNRWGR